MTDSEKNLWEELRNNKLEGLKFRRQHPVNRFIADFYCQSLKIIIELDGGIHNDPYVQMKDKLRQGELEYFGLKIIRFEKNDVILNLPKVMSQLSELVKSQKNVIFGDNK